MAATWTVTRQAADQVNIESNGDPVTGTRIFFQTGLGNTGSVFVTDANYHNTAGVKSAIQAQANQMDAVSALHA
jgi:hypothetical protein